MTGRVLRWACALPAGLLAVALWLGCETEADTEASSSVLAVSPSSATLDASSSTSLVFSVEGGTSPYTWTISDSTLATLVSSGDKAIYTSVATSGVNTVTVSDSASNSVSATVTQD